MGIPLRAHDSEHLAFTRIGQAPLQPPHGAAAPAPAPAPGALSAATVADEVDGLPAALATLLHLSAVVLSDSGCSPTAARRCLTCARSLVP